MKPPGPLVSFLKSFASLISSQDLAVNPQKLIRPGESEIKVISDTGVCGTIL